MDKGGKAVLVRYYVYDAILTFDYSFLAAKMKCHMINFTVSRAIIENR